jgi:multidrug efflux pump subunit AcrA (membrane-fusion protein)
LVELYADNPGGILTPGTYAEVHFDLPTDPHVLTIPTTALVFRRSGLQVAVLGPDGRTQLRTIKVGRNLGDTVEILTGLSASDRVIDSPPDSVENGELVKVANPAVVSPSSEMARVTPGSAARPGSDYASTGGAATPGGPRTAH